MKLFNRVASCKLGTREISGLAFSFEVKATAKMQPNTLKLSVYNLADTTRKALETKALPVELTAGYVDAPAVIFRGKLRKAVTKLDGADAQTEIEAGDGEAEIQQARIAATIAKGETAHGLLKRCAEALGVGLGNLEDYVTALQSQPSILPEGGALFGNASDQLLRVCAAYGLTPSIQGGVLTIISNKALRKTVELISPATGMIGSPELDAKGKLTVSSLMRAHVAIGDAVKVESRITSGYYRVIEMTHKGETHGKAWETQFLCDKVPT